MSEIRVRFAPSPTGNLHVGGARTAIYNWAYARRMGGKFILRIEDTDLERSTPENTEQILRALSWLGLEWDEGPDVGGEYGSYLQTERFDLYDEWLDKLKQTDSAYPCFCSADELKTRRDQAAKAIAEGVSDGGPSGYDRRCRSISADEAAARIASGEQHAWRLKIPLEREAVAFDDAVFGLISTPYQQMDDFVLVRSDGSPTYNYACVIDDIEMHISHVIRGNDHISNTPKQILIYEALGIDAPIFAHLSMILGADGSRLSKRHGATSVEAYQEAGYLPEALVNYLSLLGWSLDGETTLIDTPALHQNFSLERVSRNPAIFDLDKLNWINAAYIKEMGAPAFIDALTPYLQQAGFARPVDEASADSPAEVTPDQQTDDTGEAPFGAMASISIVTDSQTTEIAISDTVAKAIAAMQASASVDTLVMASITNNRTWYESIYHLVAERVKTLKEALPMIAYLFSGAVVKLDENSVEKCLKVEGVAAALDKVIALLSDSQQSWNHETLEVTLRQLPDQLGIKTKTLFQAIRVAICGNMVSPPLFESLELIGRNHCLARLNAAMVVAGSFEDGS
ncbi:MAG: glutamate--tRNA ligase [Coriobacteriia bacterium]|nr:glutamate--tRNA ligase [Coriobacteriia bacterium]